MRGLSLFSGIGGLDLAAEAVGIEPVAFCEIELFCRMVLKKHWPDVPIFTDVFNLKGDQVNDIDIIYGGFPCQPFSVAGKQKGKADKRHLWPEVARLVGEIKPRWCFFENVPGILKLAADDVCTDLERLGYNVGIWNYEAAAVGANHRRARIAFVANLGDSELHGSLTSSFGGINNKNDEWCKERTNISPKFEGTGGRKNGETMAYSRRALRQGSVISGTDGEKDIGGVANQLERSSGASVNVSDSETIYVQGQRDGQGKGQFGRSSRRSAEPRLGRVDDGFPNWLDRDWWRIEPNIPRVARGVKDRANRLKALGNAVVPAWAYPIFKAIVEADSQ